MLIVLNEFFIITGISFNLNFVFNMLIYDIIYAEFAAVARVWNFELCQRFHVCLFEAL